jgi:hypothetical protein
MVLVGPVRKFLGAGVFPALFAERVSRRLLDFVLTCCSEEPIVTSKKNLFDRRPVRGISLLFLVFGALVLAGCSGGGAAKVSGKVTYKGNPVTGGSVSFNPVAKGNSYPGKPAAANVQPDGTYSVEEVVPGSEQILYSPPLPEIPAGGLKEGQAAPQSPFAGLEPSQKQVEVKPGTNAIDIELIPAAKGGH